MKTSSLFLAKSWPSLVCTAALAVTTLLAPANTPAQAQVLITGFEESEGFEAGKSASGKGGWTGTSSGFTVVDDYHYSGSQSLRIDGVPSGNGVAVSNANLTSLDLSGLSLWISSPDTVHFSGASFSRFRITLSTATGVRTLQFQLEHQSSPTSANYTINYYDPSKATESQRTSFSKSYFNPEAWNEFRFEANFDDLTYSVWIGNHLVLSDIAIGGTVTETSRIAGIQLWGHSNAQTGQTYYDHITGVAAIPEPSSVALLGGGVLAGIVLLARRRKTAV